MHIRDLSPDLILTDGRFYTLDAENTVAQAVAIKDGRFVAVGSNAEIEALAGQITRPISLRGSTAIPGMFDSHVHMMEAGAKLATIRLDECASPEEMAALVAERAARTPPGTWIIGQGWNEGNFRDGRLPTRHDIDPATAEHPVVLMPSSTPTWSTAMPCGWLASTRPPPIPTRAGSSAMRMANPTACCAPKRKTWSVASSRRRPTTK
jgi:predicted amidohydrolase YtcJ